MDDIEQFLDAEPETSYQNAHAALQQLLHPEYEKLLDTIDKLQQNPLSKQLNLPLPQIIVCGNQSSGKSSVIEAISGRYFPKSHACCTTFPTRLILRRKETSFRAELKGKPIKESKDSTSFESIIENTKQLLIEDANKTNGRFKKGSSSYFRDILDIEICDPSLLPLTLVDLPGLIANAGEDQSKDDIETVKDIIKQEMEKKDSIILVVVSAKSDIQLNSALEMVKTIDPDGKRTIGVITHPDYLKGHARQQDLFISVARNEQQKLGLGWHVLKNYDTDSTDGKNLDSANLIENRDKEEIEFFSNSIWTKRLRPGQIGIEALRKHLSLILQERAKTVLPEVQIEIQRCLQVTKDELGKLGNARPEEKDKRAYLRGVSDSFRSLLHQATSDPAAYNDECFFGTPTQPQMDRRLRTAIVNSSKAFAHEMHTKGHRWIIDEQAPILIDGYSRRNSPRYPVELPRKVNPRDYIKHIKAIASGMEAWGVPSLPNQKLISAVFQDQTEKWSGIAETYVGHIRRHIQHCLQEIFRCKASDETSNAIRKWIVEKEMEKRYSSALDKIQELIKPFRRSYIITLNTAFSERIPPGTFQLGVSWESMSIAVEDKQYADTMNYVMALYEHAKLLFIDNVINLAFEQCLVDDLDNIFTPQKIDDMDLATINMLASETPEKERERSELENRCKELQQLLDLCKENFPYIEKLLILESQSHESSVNSASERSLELNTLGVTVEKDRIYSESKGSTQERPPLSPPKIKVPAISGSLPNATSNSNATTACSPKPSPALTNSSSYSPIQTVLPSLQSAKKLHHWQRTRQMEAYSKAM